MPACTSPLLFTGDGAELSQWARTHRGEIRDGLRTRGAVLLRSFDVGGVAGFDAAVREISGPPLTYAERSSPRTAIRGNVYTSTDYPAGEEIFLHNENSYQASWPLTLFFYCVRPPATQGATPLADTRRILASLDPDVREEFTRRRWMVVRNFREEFGISWREAFNASDRGEVERYCERHDVRVEWHGDTLRTFAVRDAVHTHPHTGEPVWFNHATVFHVSTLPASARAGLLEMVGEEGLPSNTYFGDGAPITDATIEHLRDRYRAASTRFDYERDDVLVIDNMLTSHGREPFTGPRKIAVAMAEAHPPEPAERQAARTAEVDA